MKKIIFFFFCISLFACSEDLYFAQSVQLDDGMWSYDEKVVFDFEVNDTLVYYDLMLDIEHDVEYTYENIYVKIHTSFPTGEKVSDEVSLQLADQLDQWQGKCSGTSCKVSILLQNRIFFKDLGQHKIEIEQFNRIDPLVGINELTLKIKEFE